MHEEPDLHDDVKALADTSPSLHTNRAPRRQLAVTGQILRSDASPEQHDQRIAIALRDLLIAAVTEYPTPSRTRKPPSRRGPDHGHGQDPEQPAANDGDGQVA